MTARASRRETEIGAPLAFRTFAFEWEHHPGFSRSVYVRLWKLNLTLSSYRGNWYVGALEDAGGDFLRRISPEMASAVPSKSVARAEAASPFLIDQEPQKC